MNSLWTHRAKILVLRKWIRSRNQALFTCQSFQQRDVTADTITIVMCAHDRSRQTYYTLQILENSRSKDIQVILVDDSDTDPIDPLMLARYSFWIDFVRIDPRRKDWSNPGINYNIGFQYIKGARVIVQNPEVCHVGDVVSYVKTQLVTEEYMIFNVLESKDFACNEQIYTHASLDVSILDEPLFCHWLQHHEYVTRNFHFLVALHAKHLPEFSYDMAYGVWYDDNDFLFQLMVVAHLPIRNIDHTSARVAGIHLHHQRPNAWTLTGEMNTSLYIAKVKHYYNTHVFMDAADARTEQDIKRNIMELANKKKKIPVDNKE